MMNNLHISGKSLSAMMLIAIVMIFTVDETSLGQSQQRPTDEGEINSTRSGMISGRVVADGQPVPNARVSLSRLNSLGQWREVPTRDDGTFQVKALELGVFSINAWAPGYASAPYDFEFDRNLHRIGESVTINIIRGGVITGKVTNPADEPVVAVRVLATMIRDTNDKRPPTGPPSVARLTDDRGIYRLYGLLPGTYVVSAGGGRGYYSNYAYDSDVPTYAPSSTRDTASEITVGSGEEIKDVDIRYRGEPGHSVSGRVTMIPPTNSQSLNVALVRVRNGISEATMSTTQGIADKGFEFNGVADGDYDILAQSDSSLGERAQSEARRISVKGTDITGIELVTRPLPTLAGQLVLIDSKLPECKSKRRPLFDETLVSAQLNRQQASKGQAQLRYYFMRPGSPNKAGEFILHNLVAGQYSLTTTFFAKYWYLQSVTLPSTPSASAAQSPPTLNRSIDASRNWIALKFGDRLKGLKIALAEGAASVEGKLKLTDDEKIPPAMYVNLIPAERDKTEDALRFFAAPVGSDGGFTVSHVPPGHYFALARITENDGLEPSLRLRLPDAVEARAKLRLQAEAKKREIELKPCQNVKDFELSLKSSN